MRLTSMLYDFLMANISRFFCAAATAAIVLKLSRVISTGGVRTRKISESGYQYLSLKTLVVSLPETRLNLIPQKNSLRPRSK